MIEVQVLVNDCDRKAISMIKTAAKKALEIVSKGKKYALTISIGSDEFVHELNKTYRNIDRPTDVLSFSEEYIIPGTSTVYLGDIAISYPTARIQAEQAGHPVINELSLLAIHGVLHLLGFDHQDEDQKMQMWALQHQILEEIGIKMAHFSGDEQIEKE